MPRANVIQTNFTSGEVSPLMRGRIDSNRYANGAETIENLIVRPQGAAWKRSGTKFIQSARAGVRSRQTDDSDYENFSGYSFLIPFENSDLSGYIIEFGEKYARFYKDGQVIIDQTTAAYAQAGGGQVDNSGEVQCQGWSISFSATLTNYTVDKPFGSGGPYPTYNYIVTTTIPHGLRDGSKVEFSAHGSAIDNQVFTITYYSPTQFVFQWVTSVATGACTVKSCQLRTGDEVHVKGAGVDLGRWRVVLDDFNDFTLIGSVFSGFGTITAAYAHIPEVTTPYLEAEVDEIYVAQSADVIYLAHRNHPPQKIYRTDDDNWTITPISFVDGPYLGKQQLSPNLNSVDITNGATYPDVYLEVSNYAHTGTIKVGPSGTVFSDPGDNGTYLEYRDGDQWRLALIGTLSDTSTAPVTIIDNVLLHVDETDKLVGVRKATRYTPGTATSSATNSGANVDKKVDPNDELQKGGSPSRLKSQFSGTFGRPDIGKYVRYHDTATPPVKSWALITGLNQKTAGQEAELAAALTMCGNNGTGRFILSAESISCTVKSYKAEASFDIFNDNDIGRLIRLSFGGRITWGTIATKVSDSEVTVTLERPMPRDPADALLMAGSVDSAETDSGITYDWRLGAWSPVGTDTLLGPGYPSVVVFHEQRLCYARSDAEPQTVWMSVSGDFENFAPTESDSVVLDDNAITWTLASTKVNPIKWMESGTVLLIGTTGGEWQMRSSSTTQEPITPTNIVVAPQTPHGSIATVRPRRVGQSIVFVNRSGIKCREIAYDFQFDGYTSKDLTVISEHILRNGTQALYSAYQQEEHSVYWLVLTDGTLAAMTFNKEQEIVAWHRHNISANSTGTTNAVVESIAVVPSAGGTEDVVYLLCKRTVNSIVERYVELIDVDFYPANSTDLEDMYFLDCGITYSGAAATTVKNLWHLEGETVNVVVDGVDDGTKVVSSGQITGVTSGTMIHVGYFYPATLKLLPPEGGSEFGTAQGKPKLFAEINARLLNTLNLSHGFVGEEAAIVDEDLLDGSTFFTGTKELRTPSEYDTESQLTIKQTKPYPLNVLSVTMTLKTNK